MGIRNYEATVEDKKGVKRPGSLAGRFAEALALFIRAGPEEGTGPELPVPSF